MRHLDRPTPRIVPDGDPDDEAAADLPLTSIPSVPEEPLLAAPERHPVSTYVIAGAALLVLIVAVSLIGARFLKVPASATGLLPPQDLPMSGEHVSGSTPTAVAAAPAPAGAGAPSLKPASALEPAPARRQPAAEVESAGLMRDLAAKTRALGESEQALAAERERRRQTERKLDELQKQSRSSKTSQAERDRSEKLLRAQVAKLEKQLDSQKSLLRAAEDQAREAKEALAARESGQSDLASRIKATEDRANQSEQALADARRRHQSTLAGEGEAVRKLMAELRTAEEATARERAGRLAAERKLKERAQAAPPPRAADPEPVRPPEVREPERVKIVPPRYPDELRRLGIGGRVQLRVLVDESGRVIDVQVSSSPDPRLGTVAAAAARNWEYSPGRRDGIRVQMWITESVDFKI